MKLNYCAFDLCGCVLEPGGTRLMEGGSTQGQKCSFNVLLDISLSGQSSRPSLTSVMEWNITCL